MKHILFILTLLLTTATLNIKAQPTMSANLQNMHLWRGGEVADGMVLTADVGFSALNKNLKFGFWGGANSVGVYKEFNYYASYSVKGLSFTLVDTYNFSEGAAYNNKEFFNYNAAETGRFLDATLKYKFNDNFPLTLSWSTVLFGRDRDASNSKNLYSTFCNIEYSVYRYEDWVVDLGVGGAFALAGGDDSPNFFGTGAGIVQTTAKISNKIDLLGYELPVFIMAMWNPQADKGYLQVGVTLFTL